MTFNDNIPKPPRLLVFPLQHIPSIVHSTMLATMLNKLFYKALHSGELDFLQGKSFFIEVQDIKVTFCLTLAAQKLAPCRVESQGDLYIKGDSYDFLLLLAGREDPDSLFFNRRLRLGGNTELGLSVKNFLAALELEGYAQLAVKQLDKLLKGIEYGWQLRSKLP